MFCLQAGKHVERSDSENEKVPTTETMKIEVREARRDSFDMDTKQYCHHCKKRRHKKRHRCHCHCDANCITGTEDREPKSGMRFEAADGQQFNIVDAEKIDTTDTDIVTCSTSLLRYNAGDGASVSALNDCLAVLDGRMLELENHFAQMQRSTQQQLQGIESLLRANLQTT